MIAQDLRKILLLEINSVDFTGFHIMTGKLFGSMMHMELKPGKCWKCNLKNISLVLFLA